jgi:hypothetical protein
MTTNVSGTRGLFSPIRDFFFEEQAPYGMALVRIFLPISIMIPMVRRFMHVRELFSSDGSPQPLYELFGQVNPLPPMAPQIAAALYGMLIIAMFCAVVGWKTRWSFLIATPLYIYFNLLDSVGTMTKYSVIASHVLVMLTLSNCGAVWSVDAILRRKELGAAATAVPPRFPIWQARLIQLLFSFVYFGAAITKIQTEAFFSGEQMRYWMLSNWNYSNPIGEQMAMWTPVLLLSGYITVVWEIVFAFLVWRPTSRLFVLGVGIMFHIMTCLTLGLYIFPLVCTSSYLAFITEKDIVALRRLAHKLKIPSPVLGIPPRVVAWLVDQRPAAIPAATLWLSAVVLAAVAAAEIEYRSDAYGMQANNGPLPLPTMDFATAESMIREQKPLRERDKYFSFDVGTVLMGNQLANRRNEFAYGERIVAQCTLNIPHGDLWVECLIQDDQNRTVEHAGQFVTREMLHANFAYETGNSLVPGRYSMVLKSSNKEVFRREFTLNGDPEKVPTMNEMMTN